MRRDRRAGLIAVLLGLTSAAEASAERVAVVPLLAVNASDARVDRLTAAIAAGLQEGRSGAVRAGREVRRRLPEAGLPPDCPADAACVQDLLTRLEVDALVFCVITSVGDRVQVDPSVYREDRPEPRPAVRAAWSEATQPTFWATATEGWLPAPEMTAEAAAPAPSGHLGWPSWPTWTAAGVSLAALGVGIGFGVSAGAGADDLEARGCATAPCPPGDIDAVGRRARVADVSYVIAGVAAATALGLYYALDVAGEEVAVHASPGGLVVLGRF